MALRELRPNDPALATILGSAQARFQHLIHEADQRARPFYQAKLGRAMGCEEAIAHIFAEVERDGDDAVARFGQLFDGNTLGADELRVAPSELAAAATSVDPVLRAALEQAHDRIVAYQRQLIPADIGADLSTPLGARWTALDRVGGYVPGGAGGSLPLCSSVLMNLVPAAVAGVEQLVMVTPPRPDGSIAPELLAAAHVAGVDEVYRVGGVPAIAALACGTATIANVDKIVGPGNIFVTLAKRHAFGRVDIDMLAGPSEVLVIADDSVNPAWIAADLLSQAEHDQLAMSVLLSTDDAHADAVQAEMARQLAALPDERRAVASASVERMGLCIRCSSLDQAVAIANRYAAEHLELLIRDPAPVLQAIRHAGAVFVGPWSPEPIGDYIAGPSHTLPTCGSARMWSGIGADTFLKRTSIINLGQDDFHAMAPAALTLARAEGLEAHARSIACRLDG
ncbi:MAG: histidinol dehydrogenase [Planctomycetota bacterium]|jgi:histidinol dehydrogenase